MNLRDLKYFIAVADLRHFGRAAERCHVSQPTLSGQIKKMEETLGVVLFERTNRRVMLTEVGERVARSARRLLNEEKAIFEIAESARDPFAGPFKLGAFPTLASYIYPSLVPQIRAEMPNLKLILVEEKTDVLVEKLRQGTIDAALLALPIDERAFVKVDLFVDPFYLAVPRGHELAARSFVDQGIPAQFELLLLEEGHCLRDQALDVCRSQGLGEYQDFRATSLETLRQMVKAGTGITLIPKIAIDFDDASVSYIPFAEPVPSRTIALFWRQTSPRGQVMEAVVDLVRHQRGAPDNR